jgi:hypothetical protein
MDMATEPSKALQAKELDEALSSILFEQYQLGRAHQRLAMTEKRQVGGEITVAKQAILELLTQELNKARIDVH